MCEWIDVIDLILGISEPLLHSLSSYPPAPAPSGESWDYMGSRRLLLDMNMNTTSTSGLNLTLIDQVIEMGQV